jgi:hypothetical protein
MWFLHTSSRKRTQTASIQEEIIIFYGSVKLIRGHTGTAEALLQTIALATILWVVHGG